MKYAVPRGTRDILPDETPLWQALENTCHKVFKLYDYQEIRTPVFESTELFSRSIGSSTDIVKKEMYEFKDRKGRSLTLRPEETAPVVRACLENNLIGPDKITKVYYLGPMFRYERPQAGRQRQFHQAGVEAFGSDDPLIDAEMILMNIQLFKTIGLKDFEVNLNSVGCSACRPAYRKKLHDYFKTHVAGMCEDCRDRFEHNPLRILDCKEAGCQKQIENAPAAIDSLCAACKSHFESVVKMLDYQKAVFKVNKRLVRGLDYYTRTTFEIVSGALGAQNAVSGGGRYDGLVEEMGGKATPAVGFAVGLERIVQVMSNDQCQMSNEGKIVLYVATMGEEAKNLGFDLMMKLRQSDVAAEMDYSGKSLKAQMKAADRLGAKHVYIIGEDEIKKESAILKEMQTGEQKEVPFNGLKEALK
jgi:histidyl-tRNA synthetase